MADDSASGVGATGTDRAAIRPDASPSRHDRAGDGRPMGRPYEGVQTAMTRGRFLAFIGLALVLIVAARLPFISNVLIDEEGSLANLVLGAQPVMQGANSLLIGRID